MPNNYAEVIIDLTHRDIDRVFTYRIPDALSGKLGTGSAVLVPFGQGQKLRRAVVYAVTAETDVPEEKLRDIAGIDSRAVSAEEGLLSLAAWMHRHYGCMLNQAVRTVMPVRTLVEPRRERCIRPAAGAEALSEALSVCERKNRKAQARLLSALISAEGKALPYGETIRSLNVTASVVRALEKEGLLTAAEEERPGAGPLPDGPAVTLNDEQRAAAEAFRSALVEGRKEHFLLHGITGSGKTEVYMEMIRDTLKAGKQAILLIPEISLTYQTVDRLREAFGDRIALIHSKLSAGERSEEFRRASQGSAEVMVGPRSALFAPFPDLGLIVIDEEHDSAYKSDTVPRYDAREAAFARAEITGAHIVLGSATPSAESYERAQRGELTLLKLTRRAVPGAGLARTHVVDLREELKKGNRSVFSTLLDGMIRDRLAKKEQVILFMNRRGYSRFVSCRSCGNAVKCPHCDVSLTLHNDGRLRCHYCGFERPEPEACPDCGSPYLAGFGTGTEKLESLTRKAYPEARVLRMDTDAASRKNAGREILKSFSEGGADILIGTQMVVKGHDVKNVTLVGIMAADTELYVPGYRSAERTFQLITQAAGRAGRGTVPGDVVIQTYRPDHYAVRAAAGQDYGTFFENEMAWRTLGGYPPAMHLMSILMSAEDEELLSEKAARYAAILAHFSGPEGAVTIGPARPAVYRIHDYFRKLIYVKHTSYDILLKIREEAEKAFSAEGAGSVSVLYDLT